MRSNGKRRAHESTWFFPNHFQFAAQLSHSLIHSTDANAERAHPVFSTLFKKSLGDTFPLIFNFENGVSFLQKQANVGRRALGMAVDSGETLLQNAEKRQL